MRRPSRTPPARARSRDLPGLEAQQELHAAAAKAIEVEVLADPGGQHAPVAAQRSAVTGVERRLLQELARLAAERAGVEVPGQRQAPAGRALRSFAAFDHVARTALVRVDDQRPLRAGAVAYRV